MKIKLRNRKHATATILTVLISFLFAACRPEQTASDATFSERANGAFTYLFLKALAEDPTRTRRDLLTAVTAGLKSGDFEQRSTLEGPPQSKKVSFGETW